MRHWSGIALLALTFTSWTCSGKLNNSLITSDQIEILADSGEPLNRFARSPCRDQMNYLPDDANPNVIPVKKLRVHFHFMDCEGGGCSLDQSKMMVFAQAVIDGCNERLAHNKKMNLPIGNNTALLPTRYRLVFAADPGISIHEDDELFYYVHGKNTNRSDRMVLTKYAVSPDSVINVFFMPHHPDSLGSSTYRAVGTGIALGTSVKIAQIFNEKLPAASCFGLLNHEVGHVIGLGHTWRGNDGCDDTPTHANCFSFTKSSPCDEAISNNMMDYNQYQNSLSPCQIGKVHRSIGDERSRIRKVVVPEWCTFDSTRSVVIEGQVTWQAARDLYGDLMIANGAELEITCRLALARGARILVAPKGRLVINGARIHNACGDNWYGIEVQSKGKFTGRVFISPDATLENAENPVELPANR